MKIAYSSANTNRYGIIFLHGIFDNSSSFKEVANELSQEHSIYLVDIINHGKADKACKMTFNLLAQKLSEIVNSIKDEEIVLIGHSLGGRIIMQYLLTYSVNKKVKKSIILDISPRNFGKSEDAGRKILLDSIKYMKGLKLEEFERKEELIKFLYRQKIKKGSIELFKRNIILKNGKLKWMFDLATIEQEFPNLTKEIGKNKTSDIETHFIKGERSDFINTFEFNSILKKFTNSSFHTIENAGHWVHLTNFKNIVSLFKNKILLD